MKNMVWILPPRLVGILILEWTYMVGMVSEININKANTKKANKIPSSCIIERHFEYT